MAKTDPDQSQQFNTMLLTAATIAAVLALAVISVLYGCSRAVNPPKPREISPGMATSSVSLYVAAEHG